AGVPPSKTPSIATRRDKGPLANNGLRLSMSRSPFAISEGAPEDFGRPLEGYALWLRDRGRQRLQERRPAVVDLPPQQHGVVLVRGVVAVLHEHPGEVPELYRDGDASVRAEAIDVLAPPLPCRAVAGTSVAGEDLALFEVG